MIKNFTYSHSGYNHLKGLLKRYLFEKVTSKGFNFFFRKNDFITITPLVEGVYEPEIGALLKEFSKKNFNDFLIDIGANIGMISCLYAEYFKVAHLYEPNPLCFNILEVNTKIVSGNTKFVTHPFGLGEKDKKVSLTVPKNHWGGAFIDDSTNSYDQVTLAKKDGYKKIDEKNYFKVDITLKKTSVELKRLFAELLKQNLKNGVIKVDVEGYEMPILYDIAKILPKNIKLGIVFESWNKILDIASLVKSFNRTVSVYTFIQTNFFKYNWPKILKLIFFLFNPKSDIKLVSLTDGSDTSGNIVLVIE